MCVNALSGLCIISTAPATILEAVTGVCQCPKRAMHHFYVNGRKSQIFLLCMCQCPKRAMHHFYADTPGERNFMFDLVSMP